MRQCLEERLGLFQVRDVEESVGAARQPAHFVTVTPRGLEALFENRPPETHKELLDMAAPPYRGAASDICMRLAEQRLNTFVAQRGELLRREEEVLAFLRQLAGERQRQLEVEKARLEKAVRDASEFVQRVGPQPPPQGTDSIPLRPPGGTTRDPGRPPVATTEEELDFQRDLSEELVYAWQDAADPETRTALERVMQNAGLEPVGEVGEAVLFDGRQHVTQEPFAAGEPAVIAEPGWRLVNSRGTYLIVRARVQKSPSPQEATHDVRHD
ncbi:MAG TPA: hypothetical protein VJ739_14205 [Gemmataceae bacterium]|nr:hypothetical protein [Gemmataceae bacterium]